MQRRKRLVAVAVSCVLVAGFVIGAAMAFDARSSATRDRHVVSHWSGDGRRLMWGALRTNPERGFVRVTDSRKSYFFRTPEGAGALRPVSHSESSWVFRSRSGALALLNPGYYGETYHPPSFEFLGRRLDPAKLGPIGSRGVAVPIDLPGGKTFRPAVVLVEQTPARHGSFGSGWTVYGYLPGFMTPRLAAERKARTHAPWRESVHELQQPLLGPDGESYSIDVKNQRLARVDRRTPAATLEGYKLDRGCTSWPGLNGALYRACGHLITVRKAHGATATILRRPGGPYSDYNDAWTFLQRSPNGRWFLLEEATEACSVATWAEFLPARGGKLARVFPGSITSSEALGWLPDNTALVAGEPAACGGNGPAGIYQVTPSTAATPATYQLVFATDGAEATSWGF